MVRMILLAILIVIGMGARAHKPETGAAGNSLLPPAVTVERLAGEADAQGLVPKYLMRSAS